MSELLKKQNYGVEVEFTGITRAMAAEAVAEVIGSTVTGPDHTCYHTRIIRDSQGRKWKIMRDSSIIPVAGEVPVMLSLGMCLCVCSFCKVICIMDNDVFRHLICIAVVIAD